MASPDDIARVGALLGRAPEGAFEVVVRDVSGEPVVIENEPFLADGTPMPTLYWLVGADAVAAVSRLEAEGGVRSAEAAVDPGELAAAHERYAALRDSKVAEGTSPRPSGGVGGTRQGVKCLHAHYAWHLAGGDDPVGRWVARRLSGLIDVTVDLHRVVLHHGSVDAVLPCSPDSLTAEELAGTDPPRPESLTNGLGAVIDAVDDQLRIRPDLLDATGVRFSGPEAWHVAQVERGLADIPAGLQLSRDELEDLFRTIATESRADRLHNPALDPARVDSVVASCCVVLGVMRRLHAGSATFAPSGTATFAGASA
jgi:hypothetical protein